LEEEMAKMKSTLIRKKKRKSVRRSLLWVGPPTETTSMLFWLSRGAIRLRIGETGIELVGGADSLLKVTVGTQKGGKNEVVRTQVAKFKHGMASGESSAEE